MIYCLIPTTKERRPRLEKCIEGIRRNTKYPITICTYENQGGGWVKNLHEMLEGINGLCFCVGDDAVLAPDCIEKLYEAWLELPNKEEWLLEPEEQFSHGEIAQFPFCHSDILKKYVYKGYCQNYSDTELTQVMKNKRRYAYVEDAIVDHQHYIGGAVYDETYKISREGAVDDKVLYEKRLSNNFQPTNENI